MPRSMIAGLFSILTVSEARLEAIGGVLDEAGLDLVGNALPGHPAEQSQQLAAVADAQAEGVGPLVEALELLPELPIEADDAGPALGRVEHVGIAEAADEDDASEALAGRSGRSAGRT